MAEIRKKFRVTAIGGTSVTLTADGPEQSPDGAAPGVWGTGTLVLSQGVAPDPNFWKLATASGWKYLVSVEITT